MDARKRLRRLRHAAVLKRHGFKKPLTMLDEADRAGISHALAAALTEQESTNGSNVFGHDPVRNTVKGGAVTEARYKEYKRQRKAGMGMQGVGPVQLTWWEFQDAADKMGGAWRPRYNWRVGFTRLRALIKEHGFAKGIERYNGSGPAAEAYSREVRQKWAKWKRRFK